MNKHRSDSVLKNLPEERQAQIIEWINTPKSDDCVGGQKFALEQLAADGIKTSAASLSDFYSWWHLQQTFRRADNFTTQIEESLRKQFPELSSEKIAEAGQLVFTLQATNARDAKEFREMEWLRLAKVTGATKARQKDRDLALAERRVRLLEKKAKEILSDTSVPIEEREQRMKAMFGM